MEDDDANQDEDDGAVRAIANNEHASALWNAALLLAYCIQEGWREETVRACKHGYVYVCGYSVICIHTSAPLPLKQLLGALKQLLGAFFL